MDIKGLNAKAYCQAISILRDEFSKNPKVLQLLEQEVERWKFHMAAAKGHREQEGGNDG